MAGVCLRVLSVVSLLVTVAAGSAVPRACERAFTAAPPASRGPDAAVSSSLTYSTLLGGASLDSGLVVRVDAGGLVYLAGETSSADFPASVGAYDESINGGRDVFVAKLDTSDWSVVYATLLGGSGMEALGDMVVDGSGAVYLVGSTYSADFPTTAGALSRQLNGGAAGYVSDVFVARLAPSGTELAYSTLLGGSGHDSGNAVWVGDDGMAYAAGTSCSGDFPTTAGAYDRALGGTCDGFVARVSADGSALVFSTYLGGTGGDGISSIAVDPAGAVYVGGTTYSSAFPTSEGAHDTSIGGSKDCFVTKLTDDATAIVYSTYLGGGGSSVGHDEELSGITVDGSGSVYVAGTTNASDFPTTSGAYSRTLGEGTCGVAPLTYPCPDAFVARFSYSGDALLYSTFLGGTERDRGGGLALMSDGQVLLTGRASSDDFPTTEGAAQRQHPGGICGSVEENYPCPSAYAVRLSASGSTVLYSTFLGGSLYDYGYGVAAAGGDRALVSGYTSSLDYPVTPDAIDATLALGDAFLTVLDLVPLVREEHHLYVPLSLRASR